MSATWKLIVADVLEGLAELEDESVQCVVTSPPYWGLRDYGVEGMIGLEPTLAEHMAKMVEVFAEVRRVLRADGTLWLNYGDAYAGAPARIGYGDQGESAKVGALSDGKRLPVKRGLAAKQRYLMPARVALALQDAGWWVRSEIVWAKGVSFCPTYAGSCMPSSVRDRPTDSHEFVYLLSKAPRYFYDGDAVRETGTLPAGQRHAKGSADRRGRKKVNARPEEYAVSTGDRNIRTVWTINPQAYREAHFATFPEALVEPCIRAGTSGHGACSECGAPWRRVVEAKGGTIGEAWHDHADDMGSGNAKGVNLGGKIGNGRKGSDGTYRREHKGWEPTCEHADAPVRPCLVLDPFNGSGTTGVVALREGCSYVGIELNPEYAALAEKRIGSAAPSLFCKRTP